MTNRHLLAVGVRWVARASAAAMFLLAGAFFWEHLREWFIEPLPETPPPYVWMSQLLHLAYLVALAVGWKWPRAGGLASIVIAMAFLIDKNPLLILPTIVPGVLYLLSWYFDRTERLQLAV
jgi:hypothetical protein